MTQAGSLYRKMLKESHGTPQVRGTMADLLPQCFLNTALGRFVLSLDALRVDP